MFDPKQLIDNKIILLLLTTYGLAIGFAYIFGYWVIGFEINIFPYLNVNNVILYSLPGFAAVILITPYLLLPYYYIKYEYADELSKRKIKSKVIGNIATAIASLSLFSWLVIKTIHNQNNYLPYTLIVGAILFAISTSIMFFYVLKIKRSNFEISFLKIIIITLFALTPLLVSLIFGLDNAEIIKSSMQYKYVLAGDINKSSANTLDKIKYLGRAGDYYFLLSQDNTTYRVLKFDNFKQLKIYQYNSDKE